MSPILNWYVVMAGVFGLIYGSFSGVVIGRQPLTIRALIPASRCDACHVPIRWYHNVPVLSWLLLRGRCAACGVKISIWSPILELSSGIMFALLAIWGLRVDQSGQVTTDSLIQTAIFVGFASNWLCIAIIDFVRGQIPNLLVATSLIWGALGFAVAGLYFGHLAQLVTALFGAAIFFTLLLAIKLLVPRGLGLGDVKLAAALGLGLGWQGLGALAVGVIASFVLGSLFGLVYAALKRSGLKAPIPFGPWMILGTWFGILFGQSIWAEYLAVIR